MLALTYIFVALASVAAIGSIVCCIIYVPKIQRVFREVPWLIPRSYPPVGSGEDHEFPTGDNLVLRGTYLQATSPTRLGVVVFCHGLGSDRWGVVPYLDPLRCQGFDVFTFDFRNHGASDGDPGFRPLPWLAAVELQDVKAAIAYVVDRTGTPPEQIALIGVSKGADAALCAAASDSRIRAVVADGAFPTDTLQRHYIRRFMRRASAGLRFLADWLPNFCLVILCGWAKLFFWIRSGYRLVNVEQMARHVQQPVFMIHGDRDGYVPCPIAREFRSRLSGRSKLWVVPGVNHNGAATLLSEQYYRRITRFLVRAFKERGESFRDQRLRLRRKRRLSRLWETRLPDQSHGRFRRWPSQACSRTSRSTAASDPPRSTVAGPPTGGG